MIFFGTLLVQQLDVGGVPTGTGEPRIEREHRGRSTPVALGPNNGGRRGLELHRRQLGQTLQELLASRPVQCFSKLQEEVVREGHPCKCRSRLDFSVQLVGDVTDLDHAHVSMLFHVRHNSSPSAAANPPARTGIENELRRLRQGARRARSLVSILARRLRGPTLPVDQIAEGSSDLV